MIGGKSADRILEDAKAGTFASLGNEERGHSHPLKYWSIRVSVIRVAVFADRAQTTES